MDLRPDRLAPPVDPPIAGTVGLLGYGRFGRAQATLLEGAGIPFIAWDPHAAIPSDHAASSMADLAARARTIVVAVPVPRMNAALTELRPYLTASHVVADVGSVKVLTANVLRGVLGDAVPWVGAHPLFGPLSLAKGERPLRVVLCPEPAHPGAAREIRALYERMGCDVVEQTPEQHDRVMAHTHALTFFVAKGMIDSGAGLDVPFAPPSFQAFARTIETVRSDAGHLFAAIARENPFADEARRGLLDSLVRIDRALETSTDPLDIPESAEPSSPVPNRPEAELPKALKDARDEIDRLDEQIVRLLDERGALVRHAGKVKSEVGLPVLDGEREAYVFKQLRAWAEERSLDPEGVEEVFRAIVTMSRRSQRGRSNT